MKTPPRPKPAKQARLPKSKASKHWAVVSACGHVCFGYDSSAMIYEEKRECATRADYSKMQEAVLPVAVLPCPTQKAARAVVKWNNLTREERIARIAFAIDEIAWEQKERHPHSDDARCEWASVMDKARALIELMEGKQ